MNGNVRIAKVYVFGNGQVMVFDNYGRQMPRYQGDVRVVMPKLIHHHDHPFPFIAASWPAPRPRASD